MCEHNKRRLDSIFKRPGKKRCSYCNCEVFRIKNSEVLDDSATIDHIYSRNDIRRFLVSEKNNVVLCCHKCNRIKNELEHYKMKKQYTDYWPIHSVMTNIGFKIKLLYKI